MLRLSPADGGRLQEATASTRSSPAPRPTSPRRSPRSASRRVGERAARQPARPARRRRAAPRGGRPEVRRVGPERPAGPVLRRVRSPPRPTTVWYDRAGSAFSAMRTLPGWALDGAASRSPPASRWRSPIPPASWPRLRRRGPGGGRSHVSRRQLPRAPVLARGRARPAGAACRRRRRARLLATRCASASSRSPPIRPPTSRSPCASSGARRGLVAITDGERGALRRRPTRSSPATGLPTSVVDRFGAGDAFIAGLLWGLLEAAGSSGRCSTDARSARSRAPSRGDHALFTPAEVRAVADEERVLIR